MTALVFDVRRHVHKPSPPYGCAVYAKYVETVSPVVVGVNGMVVPKLVKV
jgi:hypothetical protein